MGAQGQLPRALGAGGEKQLPFGKRDGAAPLPQAQKLLQGLPAQGVELSGGDHEPLLGSYG